MDPSAEPEQGMGAAETEMDPSMMAELTIYNLPPMPPVWDEVGIFYVTFCATWTTLVLAGMAFCWFNRRLPILKIRGLALSFSAIIFLHAYWILAQITYPIGPTMPVVLAYEVQYFFMSIWFPLGIALFQASNLRFLRVAKLQKQFVGTDLRSKDGCNGAHSSWLCRLRNMNYTKRIMLFISVGIVAQIMLTFGMWAACRKYHPSFGIPGTEIRGDTLEEQLIDLGRGWEWWPSVLWQVIWTWIVAPFLIWRAWGIRDTMGWRAQTIGCCLASLHATPMFMVASYVPAFEPVNQYYSPSQWIHLSIMVFEIFTVFVPVYEVIRVKMLAKKTVASNAKWETASQTTTLRTSTSMDGGKFAFANASEKGSLDFADDDQGTRLLTMGALDHVLNGNPQPLQEFSALNDFSGENIAFLTRVSAWKSSWPQTVSEGDRLDAYNRALGIYADFISIKDAEFPLNLPSRQLKHLEKTFEMPTRAVMGESAVNPATPFDFPAPGDLEQARSAQMQRYTGEIPEDFDVDAFNDAQSHIKYLVLTNTWPKFVSEMRHRRRSSETDRSELSTDSQATLASRVSNYIRSKF